MCSAPSSPTDACRNHRPAVVIVVAGAITAAAPVAVGACSPGTDRGPPGSPSPDPPDVLTDDRITIGAFDFDESELLANLYGQALESRGYRVTLELDIGPRELVQPALAGGLVELVPDYSGTALDFLSLGTATPSADVGRTHDELRDTLHGSPIAALAPSPAEDANAVVVTRRTAALLDLHDISDLGSVAPELTFGGPPECPTRPQCLAGLERTYGLAFGEFLALDAGGPLTRQALDDGHVDVAVLFTTDPAIEVDAGSGSGSGAGSGDGARAGDTDDAGDARDDLVVLRDDQHLQPAENVTPLVRTEVVERWGDDVVRTLDAVSERLTTAELRDMNAQVTEAGRRPAAVAAAWLAAEDLT